MMFVKQGGVPQLKHVIKAAFHFWLDYFNYQNLHSIKLIQFLWHLYPKYQEYFSVNMSVNSFIPKRETWISQVGLILYIFSILPFNPLMLTIKSGFYLYPNNAKHPK